MPGQAPFLLTLLTVIVHPSLINACRCREVNDAYHRDPADGWPPPSTDRADDARHRPDRLPGVRGQPDRQRRLRERQPQPLDLRDRPGHRCRPRPSTVVRRRLQGNPSASDLAKCAQTVSVAANSAYTLTVWVRGGGGYVYLGVTGGSVDLVAELGERLDPADRHVHHHRRADVARGVRHRLVRPADLLRRRRRPRRPGAAGGGGTSGPRPAAPGTPTVGTVTGTSIALSWPAVDRHRDRLPRLRGHHGQVDRNRHLGDDHRPRDVLHAHVQRHRLQQQWRERALRQRHRDHDRLRHRRWRQRLLLRAVHRHRPAAGPRHGGRGRQHEVPDARVHAGQRQHLQRRPGTAAPATRPGSPRSRTASRRCARPAAT